MSLVVVRVIISIFLGDWSRHVATSRDRILLAKAVELVELTDAVVNRAPQRKPFFTLARDHLFASEVIFSAISLKRTLGDRATMSDENIERFPERDVLVAVVRCRDMSRLVGACRRLSRQVDRWVGVMIHKGKLLVLVHHYTTTLAFRVRRTCE